MLKCEDCPLWKRYDAPGVGLQIIGRCIGPETIKLSRHAPIGVAYSWPDVFQDDYCEMHPEFDRKSPPLHDEPFWTCPPDDPGPPLKRYVPGRRQKMSQTSLFD